jgi:hypothetical protein
MVGNLPLSDHDGSMNFGGEPNSGQLLELSKKIKTFTEGNDPKSSEISEILKHMQQANKVIFLGFAFHKLNMSLITPPRIDGKRVSNVKCFATTHGISGSDKEVVNSQLKLLYDDQVEIKTADSICNDFFKEYWRSLSF